MKKEDRRLVRLTKICMVFPETSRNTHGSHAGFLVRKKTFGYFLNNHHGDGIVAVTCKVFPGDNTALIAAQPERFYMPELVACSYRLVAPKRLAAMVKVEA